MELALQKRQDRWQRPRSGVDGQVARLSNPSSFRFNALLRTGTGCACHRYWRMPAATSGCDSLTVWAALALVIVVVPVAAALRAQFLRSETAPARSRESRYLFIMIVLWSVCAIAALALRLHGRGLDSVGLRPARGPLDYALGLAVPAVLLTAGARGIARRGVSAEYLQAIRKIVPATPAQWVLFVAVAGTAGICEEFLYRGYALTQLRELSNSVPAAVILSSAAFGAAHAYQGRAGIAGASLSGLLYASVFLTTGSLLPCMAGHFVQDIAGGWLLARRLRTQA